MEQVVRVEHQVQAVRVEQAVHRVMMGLQVRLVHLVLVDLQV